MLIKPKNKMRFLKQFLQLAYTVNYKNIMVITKIKSKPDRWICKHNIQNPKIFDNNPDLYSAFDKWIYGKDLSFALKELF